MPRKEVEEYLYPMNLRVERKLLDAIEFEWRDQQYRTRTSFLIEAIEEYIKGVRCPYCGGVNPHGSTICGRCLHPLTDDCSVDLKITLNDKRNIEKKEPEKTVRNKGWKNKTTNKTPKK